MPARDLARAQATIAHIQEQATSVVDCSDVRGRRAAKRLVRMLEESDRLLSRRLLEQTRIFGGPTARFTGAQALAYQEQIRGVIAYTQARLGGQTDEQARAAIASSLQHTTQLLSTLERRFTGVATPMRLEQAAVFDATARGVRASRLRQSRTSVDRYGTAMIREFESQLAIGMAAGLTQREMVEALTGHGGPRGTVSMAATIRGGRVHRLREEEIPEGLFSRYRSWAWRIVRTETAHAYNEATLVGLFASRDADFPDLKKKILATFDKRTAYDSVVVHGQVRDLDGYFQDGVGRVYQRPPARPHDRETIIGWRPHWTEDAITRPRNEAEIAQARSQLRPAERARVAQPRTRTGRPRLTAEERRLRRAQRAQAQPPVPPTAPVRTAEQQARDRLFSAQWMEHLEFDPKHGGEIRWAGTHIGRLEEVPGQGWRGILHVEDFSTRSGFRDLPGPIHTSARAAARDAARIRWDVERDILEGRATAPDPLAARAARLRSHGVDDRPGSFRDPNDAKAWLRHAMGAEVVQVPGYGDPSLDQLNVIARRLADLPPAQMESLVRRGHQIRILPGDSGAGQDPTWGGASTTFDGRDWRRVDGAYALGSDTTRFNVARFYGGRGTADDVISHELGHALDLGGSRGTPQSLTPEFLHILANEGGRSALRKHAGWYVSDTQWPCVRESWAEGYSLSQTTPGRAFLAREAPALLNYYQRFEQTVERLGDVPRVRGVAESGTVPEGRDPRLRGRSPVEATLTRAEEQEREARLRARLAP